MNGKTADLTAIAKRLRLLAIAFGVISIAGACAWWWLVDLRTLVSERIDIATVPEARMHLMRLTGLAIELIPLAVQLWMVWLLHGFAGEVAAGQVFSTSRIYRKFGHAAMLLGLANALTSTLDIVVLTLIADRHLLCFKFTISASDLYLMLVGAILLVTASFIAQADLVQRENEGFI